MASTNHTANYSLSQFAQTDKPAWLGDYNQDMTKIDTAMKNNADATTSLGTTVSGHTTAISGLTSDVASVQSDVSSLGTRVTAVETKNTEQDTAISSAQSTATTANGKADTNATNIGLLDSRISADETTISSNTSAIEENTSDISALSDKIDAVVAKFSFTDIDTQPVSEIWTNMGYVSPNNTITLAQNSDGSLFKVYGVLGGLNNTGSTKTLAKTAVAGLSGVYGIKTSLQLNTAPTEAYVVAPMQRINGNHDNVSGIWDSSFAVGTDGYIYLHANTESSISLTNNQQVAMWYTPCLYINSNFGDIPQPQGN